MADKILCTCGCGQEIITKRHHKSRGIPKYIHYGHYKKGKTLEEIYGIKRAKEIRRKESETKKRLFQEGKILRPIGKRNGMYGKKHTKEHNQKIRESSLGKKNHFYGKKHTEESKRNMSKLKEGENNPMYGKIPTKEHRQKLKESTTKLWKDEEFIKKMINGLKPKPNKKEKILINLFKKHYLPYKYTGDFKFWIEGRNPDFVNVNGEKKVIELFGDYWHSDKILKKNDRFSSNEENTIRHYKKYGFDCLVIWEKELKDMNNVLDKIKNYEKVEIRGGR